MFERADVVLVAVLLGAMGVALIRRGRRKRQEEQEQRLSIPEQLGFWSGYQMEIGGWLYLVGAIVLGVWGACRA